jgi:hypothetical protein
MVINRLTGQERGGLVITQSRIAVEFCFANERHLDWRVVS